MRCFTQSTSALGALLLCLFLSLGTGSSQDVQVKVDMVTLPVVVTDVNGNLIQDLKKENFQVFEDGVPQQIGGFAAVQEPISVALTLDTSGSTEFQLGRIRQEAMRFIRLLREEDSSAIVTFADEVTLLEPFNLYHKKNPDALQKLKPGGLSAVYEAVWLSIEQVLNLEYGRKALVFFSDGVDTRSESVTEQETLELARKTDATIYCIYFNTNKDRGKRMPGIIDPMRAQWPPVRIPTGRGRNPEYAAGRDYMVKLAAYSGGTLIDASRIENLGAAFGRIAQELRSQYSIGYYPKDVKQDGRFRKVEVRVNRPGLTARTRQGYYFVR
jgi:Ca-activated chloride channel homolog